MKLESSPRALLDANVLYPAPLRDLLLWMGVTRSYEPRWSDAIFEEWSRNLLLNRPDLRPEQLEYTYARMNAAFPEGRVLGYAARLGTLHLPDAQDRHVLAAALESRSSLIVSFNLKDFPPAALEPLGVIAMHPDAFVLSRLEAVPAAVGRALEKMRKNLVQPPMSAEDVLGVLEQQGLAQTVAQFRALEVAF